MEHYHQITNRQRIQFWMTKDKEVNAIAKACSISSMQQYTNPEVEASGAKVDGKACRGPRWWRAYKRHKPKIVSKTGRKFPRN